MKITVIGGGPGGLYTALLTKKAKPDWTVEVYEQNQADDTFGFGVVFSDDTLDEFLSRDRGLFELMRDEFAYWQDVAVHFKGHEMRAGGNGFCGLSRHTLLRLLQQRCAEEGVEMTFGVMVKPEELATRFADSDVIVAGDGINSPIREYHKEAFQPSTTIRNNRFCWMGSTRPMDEFNYFFRETEHGHMVAHCYQYEPGKSTWVFEMDEATWQGHGFSEFDEEDSKAKLEAIFADELEGHPLLLNRSHWRKFPRIFCENWYTDNIVILGDAKASAHFSIGSGTKLAMECAIGLSDALVEHAERDVQTAFRAYDDERRTPCQIIQHNADVSLAWFEHMARNWDMEPYEFAMVVMCRAKSITYDNLIVRDAEFVRKADDEWYARHLRETGEDLRENRPTPMFSTFRLREMELANRVVMSPMAQYSADTEGNPTEWHKLHYCSHAMGGMGLIYMEMTCPSADARITEGCPGLWTDEQERRWTEIVDLIHAHSGAKVAMQLGHAGRKGSTQLGWEKMDHPIADEARNWPLYSASPIPWFDGISQTPAELDRAGMDRITADFVQAAERADRAGFDMLELHCAHGYLLASFLSPLTNRRGDEYGGPVENRLRFPMEVFEAMRKVWPEGKPMSVRVSGTDWKEDGLSEEDLVAIAEAFNAAGCDLIDVSAGQTVPDQKPVYGRMFQLHLAEAVRNLTGIATMAVGAVTEAAQVNTILHTRRADLVALGRVHLWNPYFAHQAAAWYGARNDPMWPKPYLAGAGQVFREQEKAREKMIELQKKAAPGRHTRLA
ncbi:anthraniloyl-CoA monooxygenase [Salinihabitans flavidus]|uniref:Anthraniloyl-CoA monooxygenase n=1 Tax=Salinihabitans flavidus TaxID=569882 RepID=A0A1H8U536_9RHOB|nr:FAD-dependent monooxygenase [Salinihabitans flavidus]SEO98176.1 anthraniloyl-CoA monooxygenase [Salinihabitans flavidus]